MLIILWDVKEPTHYSYKSRVIPVLWLSFVCEWGVGEVGHLVRDLEVLLCPFNLGNKSCPVEWTKKTPIEKRRKLYTNPSFILRRQEIIFSTQTRISKYRIGLLQVTSIE